MGNIGVQVITLMFYPILSRIYSPKDFGLFGLYNSTVLILGIFATGQFHYLFPNPKEDKEALSLFRAAICFNFIFSILVTVISLIFYDSVSKYLDVYSYVIGLSVFLFAMMELTKMWFIRFKAYKENSISVTVNRFLSNFLKFIFPASLGLIFSEILAYIPSLLYSFRFTSKKETSWFKRPTWIELLNTLRKYYHYPLFLTFGSFFQFLVFEMPVFAIGKVFDNYTLGNYVLAQKLSVQAIWLITSSLVSVLHNKFVEDNHQGVVNFKFLIKFLGILFVFSLPIAFILSSFGSPILAFFLGPQWGLAGSIIEWLSPLVITKLLIAPILSVFFSSERIKLLTAWRLFQAIGLGVIFYFSSELPIESFIKRYVIFDFISDLILVCVVTSVLFFQNKKFAPASNLTSHEREER